MNPVSRCRRSRARRWVFIGCALCTYLGGLALDAQAAGPASSLPTSLRSRFLLATSSKDQHGNPVTRRNAAGLVPGWAGMPPHPDGTAKPGDTYILCDPQSGLPFEIWLKRPRLELVLVPAGQFQLGSPQAEAERYDDEGPVRTVRLTKPFYLGKYEVTQVQWQAVMGPEWWGEWKYGLYVRLDPSHAMNYLSWDACQKFLKKVTGGGGALSLPTEAAWEYACRSGTQTRFCYGDDLEYSKLGEYAWYYDNAFLAKESYPHPVGRKRPNAWGLYDMQGNVWEWCADWYGRRYDPDAPASDPSGPEEGTHRVLRGGSWASVGRSCRSASREKQVPSLPYGLHGLRVCVRGF